MRWQLTSHISGLSARVGQGAHVPVDASLPDGIVHAVGKVQNHRSNVLLSAISEVNLDVVLLGGDLTRRLCLLPGPAATPDSKGQDDQGDKRSTSTSGSAGLGVIEGPAVDHGADNLCKPVEETIERAGAGVEVGVVHAVVLVDVEDVGAEEHGEQKDDPGLGVESSPKALKFASPRGVLLDNNLAVIASDDLVGVAEEERQAGTDEHEDDEGGICSVTDGTRFLVVHRLDERDLFYRRLALW